MLCRIEACLARPDNYTGGGSEAEWKVIYNRPSCCGAVDSFDAYDLQH